MSDSPHLTDSDNVFRRIHKSQYDPGRQPPFLRGAFNPAPADTDGLSCYLEGSNGCTAEQIERSGRKPGEYFVVRFSIAELGSLGLSIKATPELDPELPGHCSVPELSTSQKDLEPQRVKEQQVKLAELAAGRIVIAPKL